VPEGESGVRAEVRLHYPLAEASPPGHADLQLHPASIRHNLLKERVWCIWRGERKKTEFGCRSAS
jgi:hypothetical protein